MSVNWHRNLWLIWVAQVLSLSGFNFGLPFLPYFIQELGVTDPDRLNLWTGILSSAPAVTMGIMAPVWGYIADRWGKKIMLLRAMFCGSIILTAMSFSHSVYTVVILRIVQGLLTGTMTAAATLVTAGTPKNRLSYALGILASSSFIGISIGPLFGGIAAEFIGYRPSFLIGGIILAAGFFLVLFAVREVKTEDHTEEELPEKTGSKKADKKLISVSVAGALLMLFLLRFSRVLPIPFIPLYVQDLLGTIKGSASTTGIISFARGAVTALASATIVRLGDRYDRTGLVAILAAIATVVSIPIGLVHGLWGFSALFVLATFFLGGIEPLLQSEIISKVPGTKQGLIFGIQTTVGNLGWFFAPMAGSLISIKFGIPAVFFSMFIFLAVATAVSLLIRLFIHRKQSQ
jgi:DHA1 family multidrug resistance protein-like MFS transporter